MLIDFKFENFKSFRDETLLNMRASKVTENSFRTVNVAGEKLLRLAALYGANGGGKSNLLTAFSEMKKMVMLSEHMVMKWNDGKMSEPIMPYMPFLFDKESFERETAWEIEITLPDDPKEFIYDYGFKLDNKGIAKEWLYRKARTSKMMKCFFYRSRMEIEGNLLKKDKIDAILNSLTPRSLVLSVGAIYRIKPLLSLYNWFQATSYVNYSHDAFGQTSFILPKDFENDEKVRARITEYLRTFDPHITGISIRRDENGWLSLSDRIFISHKASDGQIREIPLFEEAAGTIKMFSLFSQIDSVLRAGSLLMVDELDSKLHPLLLRNIIAYFGSPSMNPKRAQLIFTLHDPFLLESSVLRRDEIWFCEKDTEGRSSLYSLVNFRDEKGGPVRLETDFFNGYLSGDYGAVPPETLFDFFGEK